jgi:superoxide oxidase
MLGISVLVLLVVRVIARLMNVTPRIQPEPPKWQTIFASVTHLALYVWMIGMPFLGWLTLSAEGKVVSFFGLQLPQLVGASESIADWSQELHEAAAPLATFSLACMRLRRCITATLFVTTPCGACCHVR